LSSDLPLRFRVVAVARLDLKIFLVRGDVQLAVFGLARRLIGAEAEAVLGAEDRKKKSKSLPRIYADERGSARIFLFLFSDLRKSAVINDKGVVHAPDFFLLPSDLCPLTCLYGFA
jgi:hypothetical protein